MAPMAHTRIKALISLVPNFMLLNFIVSLFKVNEVLRVQLIVKISRRLHRCVVRAISQSTSLASQY
jgi:hypothetical protein